MRINPIIILEAMGALTPDEIGVQSLERDEIVSALIQCGLKENGFVSLESPVGRFRIKRYENLTVEFPCNINMYSIRQGPNDLYRLADFICEEHQHLSWTEFHYKQPDDYQGYDPETLDQLCVFYRRMRQNKKRISLEDKTFLLQRFYDLIYQETENFAKILGVPFHKLKILNFTRSRSYPGRAIANTDCNGTIHYNRYYLFHDAETIRQVLVHELSHQKERGHSKKFSKYHEEAMLELGLIPRACAYSKHLCEPLSGAKFPTGEYCPGYDFVKFIKGDYQNFLYDVKLKQCLSSNYSK